MYTTVKISNDYSRAIFLRSRHNRSKRSLSTSRTSKRTESIFGTKSYRDGLQRAFNKAKEQVYFNPDMTNFITLTYARSDNTLDEVLEDVKYLIKKEYRLADRNPGGQPGVKNAKYIYVMEYQKRGSIHVHMIANDFFTLQVNKNGYDELVHWPHGYSSVLSITDLDNNFRPYLYLFKYMKKAQRIGKSFLHSSRNLNNYKDISSTNTLDLSKFNTVNMEYTATQIDNTTFEYYKNYLECDTLQI